MGKRTIKSGMGRSRGSGGLVSVASTQAITERLERLSKERPRVYAEFEREYRALLEGEYIEALLAQMAQDSELSRMLTDQLKAGSRRVKGSPLSGLILPSGGKPDAWRRDGSAARSALERWLRDTTQEPYIQNLYEFVAVMAIAMEKDRAARGPLPEPNAAAPNAYVEHSTHFLQLINELEDITAMRDALRVVVGDMKDGAHRQGAESAADGAANDAKASNQSVRELTAEIGRERRRADKAVRERDAAIDLRNRDKERADGALADLRATRELVASQAAEIASLKEQGDLLARQATGAYGREKEERIGRQSVTAERDEFRTRAERLAGERDSARVHLERVEAALTWQNGETQKYRDRADSRDELLAKLGVHDLVSSIDVLAESMKVIATLQEALGEFQRLQEQQERVDRESAEMWQQQELDAHEENAQRTREYQARAQQIADERDARLADFERDVSRAEVTRIIVDGHNLMMRRWADDAGERTNRTRLLALLDEMSERFVEFGHPVRVDVCFDHSGESNHTVSPSGAATVWYDRNDKGAERGTTGADRRIEQIIEDGAATDVYAVYSSDRVDVHGAVKRLNEEHGRNVHPHGVGRFLDYLEDVESALAATER